MNLSIPPIGTPPKRTISRLAKPPILQHTNQLRATAHFKKPFDILVGEWNMVGTHPALPDAAHGQSTFEWLVEGALLLWHFHWEPGGPPTALSVIGHDDSVQTCSMLYSDERGVARIYQMSLEGRIWKIWRDSPGFSQRITGAVSEDGNTITCHGELSHDGSNWEQDLDVTYTRKP